MWIFFAALVLLFLALALDSVCLFLLFLLATVIALIHG